MIVRRFFVILAALCALRASALPSAEPKPWKWTPMSIIVPAYFYPGGDLLQEWDALTGQAEQVRVTAIVNPASGPGESADPNYVKTLQKLAKAKVKTVGYLTSSYGKRTEEQVAREADMWVKFYGGPEGIQGFFIDEQSTDLALVSYYMRVCKLLRDRVPGGLIIANPGTPCPIEFFERGGPDIICIFENARSLDDCKLAAPIHGLPLERKCGLIHSQPDSKRFQHEVERADELRIGHLFVTDDVLAIPWDRMPKDWKVFVQAVVQRNLDASIPPNRRKKAATR